MASSTILLAQLEVEDCTAELFLNGAPVIRIAPPKMHIQNASAELYVVPGTNRLDVLVEPGSRPSTARSEVRELAFRPMRATGRLIRFEEGVPGLVEHGELLGEASFAWEEGRPERRVFPAEVGTQIEIPTANGRWSFQDAPPLVLDDALRAEARALLAEVEQAIRRGDTDRFWSLTELQTRDVRRAYPAVTEPYLRGDLATLFAHYRKAPDPVMPRDPADHDFRLVAGDRMLQLVDRDYSTSFKLRDPGDGSAVSYRIMLARIDGKLRIVR